jgi:hypothetical protein
MTDITTIVLHFYSQRDKNIPEVILGHEKVILWNNGEKEIQGAINAPKNYGVISRWVVGQLADTKYVLMIDNDIAVDQETVKKMYKFILEHPNSIVGLFGINLGQGSTPYSSRECFEVIEKEVDVVLGRVVLLERNFLPEIVKVLYTVDWSHSDDIVASLTNKKFGNKNYIIAGNYKNVDEGGVGLYRGSAHYQNRDEVSLKLK